MALYVCRTAEEIDEKLGQTVAIGAYLVRASTTLRLLISNSRRPRLKLENKEESSCQKASKKQSRRRLRRSPMPRAWQASRGSGPRFGGNTPAKAPATPATQDG